MSIDENIKYATEVVARDPMAVFLGIRAEEVRHAYARLSLHIRPEYLNALDRAHGMSISCLADQAVAVASNTTEYQTLIVELKINFLGAVSPGDTITAEASSLDLKRKLSLWQVEVKDSAGNRVAMAQALAYHRPRK
ncbi:PaaI family thioesterase [Desulfonema magnum]|uniref:Phenylacetic acid degradation-related domain-containing protein n=1 Tax=Desulfonema magnum TaxID=45655 RepID=A0A975GSC1_9BACT|nr:PaaI family thioesterase [Desulfonema magnum]QTA91874.1 Phenylacetic acid degradation-related domain-containing protein [Desulfonema magnum]